MFALKHFQFFRFNIFLNSFFQSISLNLKQFQHSQTSESRLPLIPFAWFVHEIFIHLFLFSKDLHLDFPLPNFVNTLNVSHASVILCLESSQLFFPHTSGFETPHTVH